MEKKDRAERIPYSGYRGIILAALYALILRWIFNYPLGKSENLVNFDFYDLFSITFIWIAPVIIGIIPMIFASNENIKSFSYRIWAPLTSVLIFFLITFVTRLEDLVCILIISIPFLFGAALGGLIFGEVIMYYRKKKGILFSIIMIPFVLCPVENYFETPTESYTIKTSVIINSSPDTIWNNIVRVKRIEAQEYSSGIFNYAGIPRPLFAELDKDTLGATRIGHFEGGLIFQETVNHWDKNRKISFDIQVIPSSIRETVFDQHILKGRHFKFMNATYELRPIGDNKTELILSSSYQLDSKINGYGSFWGDLLLTDFQERLLQVIKHRCEI